ncbi:MAG: signal recognition particle-docking protein FtsY [Desulfofustis sp.]|nr:signal recognition particle-docking protein FtsY [Desulfofustis sp.]
MLGWFKKNKKKDPLETDPPLEIESLVDVVETTEQIEKPKSDQPPVPVETGEPPPQVSPEAGPQITPEESTQSVTELDELEESSKSEPKHAEQSVSMLTRLSQRLSRTRESLTIRMDELFLGKKEIDADLFDELEEILITADLGIATTQDLLEHARKRIKRDNLSDPLVLKEIIKEQLKVYISGNGSQQKMSLPENEPFVIMVVGVNGVGKTTTIGKIARKFIRADRSVLLVAADTFRAAAVSQLKIWGERNDVRVIAQQEGADPSAVVYDAMSVAKTKDYDVVLVDTAGRLHTKVNLMEELKKIKRVMNKQLEGAPHEVLLVIDATTGQNGISQAKLFNDAVGVTGVALTKLDGTAKGGIVATITREMDLPIRFIGVGEQVDDLRDFDADEFIEALFATN